MKKTTKAISKQSEHIDAGIHLWQKIGNFWKGMIEGKKVRISDEEFDAVRKTISGIHLTRTPGDGNEPLDNTMKHANPPKSIVDSTGKQAKRKDKKNIETIPVIEEVVSESPVIDPKWLPEVETFTVPTYPTIKTEDLPHGGPKRNFYFNSKYTRPAHNSQEQLHTNLKNIFTKEINKLL